MSLEETGARGFSLCLCVGGRTSVELLRAWLVLRVLTALFWPWSDAGKGFLMKKNDWAPGLTGAFRQGFFVKTSRSCDAGLH